MWVVRSILTMSSDDMIALAAAWKELCPAYNNFICKSCRVVQQASSDPSCQHLLNNICRNMNTVADKYIANCHITMTVRVALSGK